MNHLIVDSSDRIRNNLILTKNVQNSTFGWWFGVIFSLFVVTSFAYFLYSNYNPNYATPKQENIPFRPQLWNNGVKNVPIIEYGQLPKIENGDSVQGFVSRTSTSPF